MRYASTKEKRWSRVLDKRTDLYAVAGGDGTVGRVARRLAKREIATVPVAVLPLGTANNIAESMNVRGAFKKLIAAWPDMRRVPVDVGEAVGKETARWFIESVGSGFFADMMAKEDAADESANLVNAWWAGGFDMCANQPKAAAVGSQPPEIRRAAPRGGTLHVDRDRSR